MRLPISVVKELLSKEAPDVRWRGAKPEEGVTGAAEAAIGHLEGFTALLGKRAAALAVADGRKTVFAADIDQAWGEMFQAKAAAPATEVPKNAAEANRKLALENAQLKVELAKLRGKKSRDAEDRDDPRAPGVG